MLSRVIKLRRFSYLISKISYRKFTARLILAQMISTTYKITDDWYWLANCNVCNLVPTNNRQSWSGVLSAYRYGAATFQKL